MNVIKSNFIRQYGILAILGLSYLTLAYFGLGISCPIHAITGFYCPGCGSTRAMKAILSGDLSLALQNNALFILAPLIMASAILLDKYSQRRIWLYLFLTVVLITIVLFTFFRNQPGSVFAPI